MRRLSLPSFAPQIAIVTIAVVLLAGALRPDAPAPASVPTPAATITKVNASTLRPASPPPRTTTPTSSSFSNATLHQGAPLRDVEPSDFEWSWQERQPKPISGFGREFVTTRMCIFAFRNKTPWKMYSVSVRFPFTSFHTALAPGEGSEVRVMVNCSKAPPDPVFSGSFAETPRPSTVNPDVAAPARHYETPRPVARFPGTLRFTGSGNRLITHVGLDAGLYEFELRHDGSSNFAVWILTGAGEHVALIANEIGVVKKSKAARIANGADYVLNVEADGEWEILITNPL